MRARHRIGRARALWGAAVLAAGLGAPAAGAAPFCPPAPAAVVDITSNRFYSDAANSIPDPALVEKRRLAVRPLEEFRAEVTRLASRSLAGNREWGACAGTWLAAWAAGDALLGRMSETQAHYERVWALSAFAMAYLMAKPDIVAADRAGIEGWLRRVGHVVAQDEPARRKQGNNHLNWLGFALGAAGAAGQDDLLWGRARAIYRTALGEIAQDGTLAKETARAGMALHYHAFAAAPLVMLAELAARRGEDWYAVEGGALHRLAAVTLAGFRDPAAIAKRAGSTQKPLERQQLAWLALYARRFTSRVTAPEFTGGADIWFSLTGGNMSLLARKWPA